MEVWRQIERYPNYDASSEGRIRNRKTGRILKTNTSETGYERLSLSKNSRQTTERVHRIIADTFIDGDKSNNRIDNLEFCTRQENIQHAFRTGLSHGSRKKAVRIIETGEEFDSTNECAIAIGADRTQIKDCLHGKCKTYKGLHFEYI